MENIRKIQQHMKSLILHTVLLRMNKNLLTEELIQKILNDNQNHESST